MTKKALTLNIQSAIDDFMGSFIVSQKVSGVFNPQEKEQKKSTSICFEQLLKAYETHLLQGWKGVFWIKESKLQNEAARNILHDLYWSINHLNIINLYNIYEIIFLLHYNNLSNGIIPGLGDASIIQRTD